MSQRDRKHARELPKTERERVAINDPRVSEDDVPEERLPRQEQAAKEVQALEDCRKRTADDPQALFRERRGR